MFKKLAVILFMVPAISLAWGPVGHRTVAEIAERNLSEPTKAKLKQFLAVESIVPLSTWADSIKQMPEWKFASVYHYEDMPDQKTYLEFIAGLPAEEAKKGGVVSAFLQADVAIASKAATDDEKRIALKFLIHLVGDLHQPLHTGRAEDRGGNDIKKQWGGSSTNLHAIWDSGMINTGHRDILANAKGQEEKVYADYLQKKFKVNSEEGSTEFQPTAGPIEADINTWIAESLSLRTDVYKYKDESEASYTTYFMEMLDKRVYVAGIRLAQFLERLEGNLRPSPNDLMRQAVEKILGPLSEFIFFHPKPADKLMQVGDFSDYTI